MLQLPLAPRLPALPLLLELPPLLALPPLPAFPPLPARRSLLSLHLVPARPSLTIPMLVLNVRTRNASASATRARLSGVLAGSTPEVPATLFFLS